VAVVVALTLLPAILGFFGERLRPKPGRWRRGKRPAAGAHGAGPHSAGPRGNRIAAGWVRLVTRRPLVTVLLVVITLGAVAIPAKDLSLALPGNATAPRDTTQRKAFDLIDEHFGPGYNAPLLVTADNVNSTDPLGLMKGLSDEIRKVPGVKEVPLATPNRTADIGIVAIVPTAGADSPQTHQLVADLRGRYSDFKARFGVATAVTGQTAVAIDISDRLAGALLPFGLFVVGLSLILLGLVFRSILVPVKAAVGFALSVGVSFGVAGAV
jgi:RND superfamily putative drug exporter